MRSDLETELSRVREVAREEQERAEAAAAARVAAVQEAEAEHARRLVADARCERALGEAAEAEGKLAEMREAVLAAHREVAGEMQKGEAGVLEVRRAEAERDRVLEASRGREEALQRERAEHLACADEVARLRVAAAAMVPRSELDEVERDLKAAEERETP